MASCVRILSSKRDNSLVGSITSIEDIDSCTCACASAARARATSCERRFCRSSSLVRIVVSPALSCSTVVFICAMRGSASLTSRS